MDFAEIGQRHSSKTLDLEGILDIIGRKGHECDMECKTSVERHGVHDYREP